jgi:hypothetical protein
MTPNYLRRRLRDAKGMNVDYRLFDASPRQRLVVRACCNLPTSYVLSQGNYMQFNEYTKSRYVEKRERIKCHERADEANAYVVLSLFLRL